MTTATPAAPGGRLPAPLAFLLLVSATVVGLAGIDLVLPAVPDLPGALGGGVAWAQLVLAAYAGGTGAGLLLFGALGDRRDPRALLAASLAALAALSLACAAAPSLPALVALRALQGVAAAAGAVYAPAMIRRLYDERAAVRALGALGSVESLVPALAPLAGAWLVARGGWRGPFLVTAAAAAALAGLAALARRGLPAAPPRVAGGYARLLRDPRFLRYALSQACTLGGLLVFVFGAPVVIVRTMGGTVGDFVAMQATGVAAFVVAANASGRLAERVGAERVILAGTALAALSGAALLAYGLAGGARPALLVPLFAPMNAGLGLRGPAGFHRAIVAAGGDDARGAALVVLAIAATASLGTAALAPHVERGLPAVAGAATLVLAAGVALLALLPPLDARAAG